MPDDAGGFNGQMIYDLENYGQMLTNNVSNICFRTACKYTVNWRMDVQDDQNKFANYSVFIDALNYYLFQVTQFNPKLHWNDAIGFEKQYCFERMYFDMGARKFRKII